MWSLSESRMLLATGTPSVPRPRPSRAACSAFRTTRASRRTLATAWTWTAAGAFRLRSSPSATPQPSSPSLVAARRRIRARAPQDRRCSATRRCTLALRTSLARFTRHRTSRTASRRPPASASAPASSPSTPCGLQRFAPWRCHWRWATALRQVMHAASSARRPPSCPRGQIASSASTGCWLARQRRRRHRCARLGPLTSRTAWCTRSAWAVSPRGTTRAGS
mmetsp:Transcript_1612/g.4429  ORF Transcript_1612/g.4429 Transcript_1612/m.4429 type:complete len:222 (-) Transcript_1612:376-1041(-)